jgi:hypothetical protein
MTSKPLIPSLRFCIWILFRGFRFPLGLLGFNFPYKDVVRDGVPGIVNADEEQDQRRSAKGK